MSEEKRAQLIEEGKLWPSGERKVVCPLCGHELPEGEQLPGTEGDGTAVAETLVVGTSASDEGASE